MRDGNTDFAFASGYIACIGYILYFLYKKIVRNEKIKLDGDLLYIINLLYLYLGWEKFVIGYTRYAGIIIILSTILLIKIMLNCIEKKSIIAIFIIAGVLFHTGYNGVRQYINLMPIINYDLALHGNEERKEKIINNIKKVFKDKNKIKYDIDGIWGVIGDDSAVPLFLNVNDRIIHIERGIKTGETEKTMKIYWNNILNNDIYVPIYKSKLKKKLDYFDKYQFEIIEIVEKIEDVSFFEDNEIIYIVKVKYNKNISSGNEQIFEKLYNEM